MTAEEFIREYFAFNSIGALAFGRPG